jgi:NodT family efflux transporter outer membrane factor (OMF) lipoprotein
VKRAAIVVLAAALAACAPKVRYEKPAPVTAPAAFAESADWKLSAPAADIPRGAWWTIFQDPQLDALEAAIDVSNQTLKIQEARFRQARAALGITRSQRFPTITASPSVAAVEQSGNRSGASTHSVTGDFLLPVDLSYEADVWGRIRQATAAARAEVQASAADLESVRLSLHAELAADYFQLRGLDAEKALLDNSVAAFQRALDLTRSRFQGGIASQADVAQAETQLETTRAEAIDIQAVRAGLEHAIAELAGKAPSEVRIAPLPLDAPPPSIPAGLPSELLERRPDIAAAERRVAEASANLGVARAAFFPRLLLTAAGGFESTSIARWLRGLSTFWSAGPALAVTLADGGRRRAGVEQAQAVYDESVAQYQAAILQSLREVEDSLATLRVLQQEADVQAAAVAAAERSLTLATNRYRGGVASYLEVITAQNAALANERAAVSILSRRLVTSVVLVKALGGGFQVSSLTTTNDISDRRAALYGPPGRDRPAPRKGAPYKLPEIVGRPFMGRQGAIDRRPVKGRPTNCPRS